MALTQPPILRQRILSVLAATESGSLDAVEAKKRVNEVYGHTWTAADRESFQSRQDEAKWWSRLGTQHQRMVEAKILEEHTPGRDIWTLTDLGWAEARKLTLDGYSREQELERRQQMWQALLDNGGPTNVQRGLVNTLGIFEGQPGFFVPAMTRTPATPDGVAVSFLNTGKHYDDEVTATGATYHYPKTARRGRNDEAEVAAAKAAFELGLPVFFITTGSPQTTRSVRRGYIEDMDDAQKVLLVTFTDEELPPPPTKKEIEAAFKLIDDEPPGAYGRRRNRPNQVRFAFQVRKRYGGACAVCDLEVKGLVQAAHLVSKMDKGNDDPRNGLPLCANHHLAFDPPHSYWSLDADLKLHASSNGPELLDLGITRVDLSHLPRKPHPEAIAKVWTNWQSKHTQPG